MLTFLFRFIMRIVLPVMQVTSATQKKMREMQNQMEEMQKKAANPEPKAKPRRVEGDYIDYEEVK